MGINHVALEVGTIEEALEFYGKIFDFKLRHKDHNHAFIDLGDQFLALMKSGEYHVDKRRHLGLVVDDRHKIRALLKDVEVKLIDEEFLDFLDPWGNYIQVVEYSEIQFTKLPEVLESMGIKANKNKDALRELRAKGIQIKG